DGNRIIASEGQYAQLFQAGPECDRAKDRNADRVDRYRVRRLGAENRKGIGPVATVHSERPIDSRVAEERGLGVVAEGACRRGSLRETQRIISRGAIDD